MPGWPCFEEHRPPGGGRRRITVSHPVGMVSLSAACGEPEAGEEPRVSEADKRVDLVAPQREHDETAGPPRSARNCSTRPGVRHDLPATSMPPATL